MSEQPLQYARILTANAKNELLEKQSLEKQVTDFSN